MAVVLVLSGRDLSIERKTANLGLRGHNKHNLCVPFTTVLPFNPREGISIHVVTMLFVTFTSLCLSAASEDYRSNCWQMRYKHLN